jgi:phosphotriesterase-related protein
MALPKHIFAAPATLPNPVGKILSVTGPIDPSALGMTLMHEHVLVDFIGADRASPDRYDRDEVVRRVVPHLKQAAELGCRTIVECTPAYLGRDPLLLKRVSNESGVQLITNTGYYGAGPDFKYLPAQARTETADQLADRWTREFEQGIGESGVRPGFIKIGVNNAPLHELHRKLVQAAARTHLRTGLVIAAHTGDGKAAIEELEILRAENVSPSAFVWVHAQSERDPALHQRAFEQGAWLSFDGVGPNSVHRHVDLVRAAKQRGHLAQVLLSHDAGWYRPGETGGGEFRPYDTLFVRLLPALRDAGISDPEIRQLTVENPAGAMGLGHVLK